jgi:hypothetical protein
VIEGSTTAPDGCGECALGCYSSGDENTNCLPQVCPAGHKAAKAGARTETDICEISVAGKFSEGGSLTSSSSMACPKGKINTLRSGEPYNECSGSGGGVAIFWKNN